MTYRSIGSILTHGLDQAPSEPDVLTHLPVTHENVRGAAYYAVSAPDAATATAPPCAAAPPSPQLTLILGVV